ncbi:MAG: hypothetical protein GY756_19890 [bacterium]|nr:hypothetical protein [bacterium]
MKKHEDNFFMSIKIAITLVLLVVIITIFISTQHTNLNKTDLATNLNSLTNTAEYIHKYILKKTSNESYTHLIPTDKPKTEFAGLNSLDTSNWVSVEDSKFNNIYNIKINNINLPGVYGAVIIDDNNRQVFCEIHIWQNVMQNSYVQNNITIGLNVEISYPIEKPYFLRDKLNFYFELFSMKKPYTYKA